MLTEPEISKEILKQTLRDYYNIHVSSFIFNPIGESSHSYKVIDLQGKSYFLKLLSEDWLKEEPRKKQEQTLALLSELAHILHGKYVDCPIATKKGKLTTEIDKYLAILFPFIDGTKLSPLHCSDHILIELAQAIAAIHQTSEYVTTELSDYQFVVNYGDTFKNALNDLEKCKTDNNLYKQKLAELLLPIKPRLLNQLKTLQDYASKASQVKTINVITHSDLTSGNLLIDDKENIHIIDWEEVSRAPREQDLFFFLNNRLDMFMEAYQKVTGRVQLNTDIFAYYVYNRYLGDLNDWVTRILYKNQSREQNESDLQGIVDDCLSISFDIESRIEEIERIIKKPTMFRQ
jgi:Ser/Thr protein kinase RdoA (MazF antagonist)